MKEKGAGGWAKENLRAWPKGNGWEEGIGGTIVVEGKGRGLVTVCDKLVLLHEDFLLPSRSPTLLFCTVKSCANCLLRTSILLFSLSMIFYLGIKNSCKVLCNLPQFSITHSNSLPLFGKFPGLLTPIPSLVLVTYRKMPKCRTF